MVKCHGIIFITISGFLDKSIYNNILSFTEIERIQTTIIKQLKEKNKNRQNMITMNHILAKNNKIYNFS